MGAMWCCIPFDIGRKLTNTSSGPGIGVISWVAAKRYPPCAEAAKKFSTCIGPVNRTLMRLVEDSIRERSKFSLSDLGQQLFGNKIIAA
jgi:hypothetical protein